MKNVKLTIGRYSWYEQGAVDSEPFSLITFYQRTNLSVVRYQHYNLVHSQECYKFHAWSILSIQITIYYRVTMNQRKTALITSRHRIWPITERKAWIRVRKLQVCQNFMNYFSLKRRGLCGQGVTRLMTSIYTKKNYYSWNTQTFFQIVALFIWKE